MRKNKNKFLTEVHHLKLLYKIKKINRFVKSSDRCYSFAKND
jgi:hypothetical protein